MASGPRSAPARRAWSTSRRACASACSSRCQPAGSSGSAIAGLRLGAAAPRERPAVVRLEVAVAGGQVGGAVLVVAPVVGGEPVGGLVARLPCRVSADVQVAFHVQAKAVAAGPVVVSNDDVGPAAEVPAVAAPTGHGVPAVSERADQL